MYDDLADDHHPISATLDAPIVARLGQDSHLILECARDTGHRVMGDVVADLRALPFRDGTFEAVFCADDAIPDEAHPALASLRRVLRPGGLLIVTSRPYAELAGLLSAARRD